MYEARINELEALLQQQTEDLKALLSRIQRQRLMLNGIQAESNILTKNSMNNLQGLVNILRTIQNKT